MLPSAVLSAERNFLLFKQTTYTTESENSEEAPATWCSTNQSTDWFEGRTEAITLRVSLVHVKTRK